MTRKSSLSTSLDVSDGDDVGVPNTGCDTRLVQETRGEVGVESELRVQPLDGDEASEPLRSAQASKIDACHPAGGDALVQLVPPKHQEFAGDRKRHAGSIVRAARALSSQPWAR